MGNLRGATERDLDAVLDLWSALMDHHAAIDRHYARQPGVEQAYRSHLERMLRDEDASLQVWDEDGRLRGFCLAQVAWAPPLLAERARVEINDLMVDPEARRRGIGRALVQEVTAWAHGRGALRVEVRVVAGNEEGQAFWRSLGYEGFVDVLQRRL